MANEKKITDENIVFYNDDGTLNELYPDMEAFLQGLDQALIRIESKDAIDITQRPRRTNLLLLKND